MKKAYLYQRFSSEKQKGNSSLYRQTEEQEKWLINNPDVEVAGRYVDEGLSGYKGEHLKKGALGKLVAEIEEGLVEKGSIILVEHFSRLSRLPIQETEKLLHKIWDAGISIVTVTDNQWYTPEDANDMPKRVKLLVEIDSASKESEWRQKKVKGSYENRYQDAKTKNITPKMRRPFWLGKDGKLNGNEGVIQDIFQLYISGLGQQRIIVSLRKKYKNLTAVQKMNPSTVMRWLQSDVVRGYWRDLKVYDAAIDDETFYTAQTIHKSRLYENVKPDRNWPLSGLMECGICGRGMSIQKSKGSLPVVRCSSKQRDRSCDRKTTFPYFIVHQYMFATVQKEALKKYTTNSNHQELVSKLSKLEHEKVKLTVKQQKESELYDELMKDGNISSAVMSKFNKTSIELESVTAQIDTLKESLNKKSEIVISKKASELVLTPRNFNLEMHKLGFKIVVHEEHLTAKGFDWELSPLHYHGYCRKEKAYKYTHIGKDMIIWPVSSITEEILMLDKILTSPILKNR